MKIGTITQPNQKGQIVIPKQMREKLKITHSSMLNLILRENVIYIYPIEEVITKTNREISYLELLKKTQGSWSKENWVGLRKKRRKIELGASTKRKQQW